MITIYYDQPAWYPQQKNVNTTLPTAFRAVSTCCLSLVYLIPEQTLLVSERQKIVVIILLIFNRDGLCIDLTNPQQIPMVCTLIYHKNDVKMFLTQVELGVGSFRSRKNSVDFFYGNIDWQLWRPFLLKFLGHSLGREKGKLRRHFVFSIVCTSKLKIALHQSEHERKRSDTLRCIIIIMVIWRLISPLI